MEKQREVMVVMLWIAKVKVTYGKYIGGIGGS
jgi:hypothetical protein